ncbi:MAG: L-histidine N(alpha)-methyltransferase [Gaiellaceae bacterium]
MHSSTTSTESRVRVERLFDEEDRRSALHDATFWGLRERPKSIPPVWLYDERGSLLFDQITRLPEYYPTRREHEILEERATEIAARTQARTLVELGSGTSTKTRLLLDALAAGGTLECFMPLDVSEEVLRASALAIAERYPSIGVHALVADFERHLGAFPPGGPRIVAFLGGTIGNLDEERRAGLLASIAAALGPGDALLLGVDLVKAPERIEAAYNDAQGVTEAFLRNGLEAVNRELAAGFRQDLLEYAARWDTEHEWMDIGFRARVAHVVAVRGLEVELTLDRGEPLRLEISAKFRPEGVSRELTAAGLRLEAWWADRADDFALALARRR